MSFHLAFLMSYWTWPTTQVVAAICDVWAAKADHLTDLGLEMADWIGHLTRRVLERSGAGFFWSSRQVEVEAAVAEVRKGPWWLARVKEG